MPPARRASPPPRHPAKYSRHVLCPAAACPPLWRFVLKLLATIPAVLTVLVLTAAPSHATAVRTAKPAATAGSAGGHRSPLLHARQVIAFFDHHPRQARTPAGARAVLKAAHTLDSTVRSLQTIKAAKAAEFPPHHALWLCIEPFEGPHDSNPWSWGAGTSWAHSGGLGMNYDWGYGMTVAAGSYPESVQEWAAERWWADQGYSWQALYDAWYQWDAADGCGTTG